MTTDATPRAAAPEVPSAGEVRGEIRDWRRGRADLRWGEVISDAYVAGFSVVMVAAMGGNVVLSLRRLADEACLAACAETRAAAPWLAALAVALLALGVARLLGPVFSPPAANAWLLSTPVDRGALLRPGWWRTAGLTALGALVLLSVPAALGGFSAADALAFALGSTATALALVAVAALSQVREDPVARRLTWLVTAALWVSLALAATNRVGALAAPSQGAVWAVGALGLALAAVLTWRAAVAVGRVPRRVLGYTENLSPSLSGALSSVDLGLMYDVLLARRWGRGAHVRSRTGGPTGWPALVHRDLLRAVRAPQPYALLAGLVLVPYAAAEADAGRAVVLVTTLVGLLGGPALCSGLRVVVRSGSLARMLPVRRQTLVLSHLAVPGTALVLFALATTGTLLPVSTDPGAAVALALGCALSTIASTLRWVCGKPPNYAAPLVSTPGGAVPTGLFSSAARGFDVWAFTALPLMFGEVGLLVSCLVSVGVISWLVSDGAGSTT